MRITQEKEPQATSKTKPPVKITFIFELRKQRPPWEHPKNATREPIDNFFAREEKRRKEKGPDNGII